MRKSLMIALSLLAAGAAPMAAQASPESDLKQFQEYFMKRFPGVSLAEFGNGVYAIDKASREQWKAIEEFPPYETAIDEGDSLFHKPFANGKSYSDCFPNAEKGIRQNYPYFDTKTGQVKTLEGEINECRVKNGEEPLKWEKGKIASISAYLAYKSRGKKLNVKIPNDPRAMAAYERGKHHFYAKRGQLNLSCANCHQDSSGMHIRADILSPALGHPSHFPVYRSKWGDMGTLHRRYVGCNKQVRAKPFKPQSDEYKALEYFETYMSNGIPVNGPGARK